MQGCTSPLFTDISHINFIRHKLIYLGVKYYLKYPFVELSPLSMNFTRYTSSILHEQLASPSQFEHRPSKVTLIGPGVSWGRLKKTTSHWIC